jgi:hypothetical protein
MLVSSWKLGALRAIECLAARTVAAAPVAPKAKVLALPNLLVAARAPVGASAAVGRRCLEQPLHVAKSGRALLAGRALSAASIAEATKQKHPPKTGSVFETCDPLHFGYYAPARQVPPALPWLHPNNRIARLPMRAVFCCNCAAKYIHHDVVDMS